MSTSTSDERARRVPFGSPMTDVSAQSSTSSPPLKKRVREKLEAGTSGKTNASASAKLHGRSGLPSLNLITDFSKTSSGQALDPLGDHRRQDSIQERRKKARRNGSRGLLDTIKDADSRVSGLSPSDRTLVIGIALQPEKVDVQRGGLVTNHPGNHQGVTPEIVITPAALDNPWNLPNTKYRPRSSVYSQATQHARGVSQFGNIPVTVNAPPVPPIPPRKLSVGRKSIRPTSAASWRTDICDDDRDALRRRFSGESQLGILRTKSVNTVAKGHASKGWWNTLLSPLLDRSSTMVGRKSFKSSVRKLNRSSDKKMAGTAREDVGSDDEKKSESPESLHTAVTPWEENRHTLAFFNDSPTDLKHHSDWQPRGSMVSPDFIPEKGFGEAAEYFEACWHDLHSPTPFFECQNHSCRRLWFYRHGPVIGGPDAAYEAEQRALANKAQFQNVIQPGTLGGGNGEEVDGSALNSPVLDSARSLKSPHTRNLSDGTDIDEEPDAASEQHNPRSIPPSNTSSPKPDTKEADEDGAVESYPPNRLVKDSNQPELTIAEPPPPAPAKPSGPILNQSQALPQPGGIAPSSPAFTPGLQREFANRNAIPMQETHSALPPSTTPAVDPLRIDEPRAAPQPPQPRSLEPEANPASSHAPVATVWSPLGNHPVEPQGGGLGIDTSKGSARGHSPAMVANHYHGTPQVRSRDRSVSRERIAPAAFEPPPRAWPISEGKVPIKPKTRELKEQKHSKDRSSRWILACCFSRPKTKRDRRRRKLYILIGGGLLAMVLLILILVLTLTLPRSDIPIQDSWLNITGFPPIPTGIATIAQPNAAVENPQCVAPTTMWSCAVPKEQQQSIAPNQPDQPNFRVEIRFQNGSAAINSTNSKRSVEASSPVSARQFIHHQVLRARDSFSSSLFTPNPSPPSQEDQAFLGNTTDNNTTPSAGEATPFFISFVPTTPSSQANVLRRQTLNPGTNSTNPFPNISVAIPPPSVNSDGTATAANLYPFPSAQPLQLYNRGRSDEHYGFYTYFDRSIFLRSSDLLNNTSDPNVPSDEDGGSQESAANVRCTWAQTRFLVQIWTNAGNAVQLLSGSNATNTTNTTATATASAPTSTASGQDSADDFARPGSFPYPVSITLDRHGGDIATKMIYCYGMDEDEHIVANEKQIHIENRAAGGSGLINPAQGIFAQTNVSTTNGGPGGIDGGFGGCRCLWQNWAPR